MELETVIIAVGTTLCGVVAFLFKQIVQLNREHIKLTGKMGELKGRQDGIEQMSQNVLNQVHLAVQDRPCENLIKAEMKRRAKEQEKHYEENRNPGNTSYAVRVPKPSN